MRPLTVAGLRSSRPLSWRRLPVCGCSGGGKSRFRGVESELHSGLIGGRPEGGEQVADLFLAAVNDLAGGGLVDGVGDIATELRELALQLLEQFVGGQLRLGLHGRLLTENGPTQGQGMQRRERKCLTV